jgi:hypothetical protein
MPTTTWIEVLAENVLLCASCFNFAYGSFQCATSKTNVGYASQDGKLVGAIAGGIVIFLGLLEYKEAHVKRIINKSSPRN